MKLDIGKDAHLTSELISTIAGDMYRRQLIHDPDFVRLFDKTRDSPLQQVLISTTGELVAALNLGSNALFSHYLSWFSVIARSAGIGEHQLRDHLRLYRLTLQDHVAPETRLKLEQLINTGEAALNTTPKAVRCCSIPNPPYTDLCQSYLAAVLDGDKHLAHEIIETYLSETADLRGVYTHVLQPAQNELGRLWEIGKLTPAEEHLGTAITQEVISGIDHRLFRTTRVGKSFVGACIDTERHDIGMRVVTAFFELDGWDTYFLGATTPRSGLIEFLRNKQPSVVGLSCSLGRNLPLLKATIAEIRKQPELRTTPVIVGGAPFNADSALAELVGADSYTVDADHAVLCAESALAVLASSSASKPEAWPSTPTSQEPCCPA